MDGQFITTRSIDKLLAPNVKKQSSKIDKRFKQKKMFNHMGLQLKVYINQLQGTLVIIIPYILHPLDTLFYSFSCTTTWEHTKQVTDNFVVCSMNISNYNTFILQLRRLLLHMLST